MADHSTMRYLQEARMVALNDPASYSKIVPVLLPIVGPHASTEQRRWGADFMAEMFASPIFPQEEKQQLAVQDRNPSVLDTLLGYIENEGEDPAVIKSSIQVAASIYPLIFKQTIKNPNDQSWSKLMRIKSNILRRMDSAPLGIRICCIKFLQRIIQTQTPGYIDPRRPEQSEISSGSVPRDHPVLVPGNLEAEATALLDRLLDILKENISDALVLTATLNSLGSLIRLRPVVASKIVGKLLDFNPFKLVNSPMTSKNKVILRSVERTTRSLLLFVVKRCPPFTDPSNPYHRRIDEHLRRMQQARIEAFDESQRKRPFPTEPTDGLDNAKRARVGVDHTIAPTPAPAWVPQLPTSFAELFTVTSDPNLKRFDASAVPSHILLQILTPLLAVVDDNQFKDAMATVISRHGAVSKLHAKAIANANAAAAATSSAPAVQHPGLDEDDDEYDPAYDPAVGISTGIRQPEINLGPFRLPTPPPLSDLDVTELGKGAVTRLYEVVEATDDSTRMGQQKKGFNRFAASNQDRDSWVTVMIRLATRATAGLDVTPEVKSEYGAQLSKNSVPNIIRENLYNYVLGDWRRRIGVGIQWLTEEWYNDCVIAKKQEEERGGFGSGTRTGNYETLTLRLMDGFLEYLDVKDQATLIRFLGEMPELNSKMLAKVKELAKDPERIGLVVKTLHYLVLMRPPARDLALDVIVDMWRSYDGAKGPTKALITKWRPFVLEDTVKVEAANGV